MKEILSLEQKDALTEVITIGAGNAATALSQMLRNKVGIEVPSVEVVTIKDASRVFGDEETVVTSVYMEILGDVSGVILFSFKKDEANLFSDMVLGRTLGETKILNEMAVSALKETSSILSGAYLNAISKLLGFRMLLSSPGFAQDMGGAIIDAVLAEICKEADYSIIMNTEISIVGEKIEAFFFFIPDVGSLQKIINAMGVDDK